jgi:hypothetical protein
MFKSIAAAPFRKTVLALGALATLAAASPSLAGGYIDADVIYAEGYDNPEFRGDDHRRPIIRHLPPVVEDYDVLPARQIVRQLRRQGYGNVQQIALRGDTYRVVAVRNNGALVKLRVDAYSGEILSATRVGWVSDRVRPLPRRHTDPGVTIEFGWGSRY